MNMAKVLITGASGGFGKLTVNALIRKGHTVVATMRDVQGRNKAVSAELSRLGAHVLEMDVTKDASVEGAVEQALKKVGTLDAVINNAGVGVLGIQETFTPDDLKRIFDVNVFGLHRVSRAVLPTLRKQGNGLLLNISSLLGRITIPFMGPYNASKWAVEALTENYRVELSQFGVDVCMVEPGGYHTTFVDNLVRPSDTARKEALGEVAAASESFLQGFDKALAANPAQKPQDVADAIVKLVETPAGQRPLRTVVDKMGMGDQVQPYNEQLSKLTAEIYGAFGIGHLLQLKTGSRAA
jgi:NAD(P)-dependent dehydrogenase (short-subunit alcohol dehydrogenase family)